MFLLDKSAQPCHGSVIFFSTAPSQMCTDLKKKHSHTYFKNLIDEIGTFWGYFSPLSLYRYACFASQLETTESLYVYSFTVLLNTCYEVKIFPLQSQFKLHCYCSYFGTKYSYHLTLSNSFLGSS